MLTGLADAFLYSTVGNGPWGGPFVWRLNPGAGDGRAVRIPVVETPAGASLQQRPEQRLDAFYALYDQVCVGFYLRRSLIALYADA